MPRRLGNRVAKASSPDGAHAKSGGSLAVFTVAPGLRFAPSGLRRHPRGPTCPKPAGPVPGAEAGELVRNQRNVASLRYARLTGGGFHLPVNASNRGA